MDSQHGVYDDRNGEGSALLGQHATPKKPLRDGQAGLTSSVGNLANTIIGSGARLKEHRSLVAS